MDYLSCTKAAEKKCFLSIESNKCTRTGRFAFRGKEVSVKREIVDET